VANYLDEVMTENCVCVMKTFESAKI